MDFIRNYSALNASISFLLSVFFIWWLEPHTLGQIGFIVLMITSVVVVITTLFCIIKRFFNKTASIHENDRLES